MFSMSRPAPLNSKLTPRYPTAANTNECLFHRPVALTLPMSVNIGNRGEGVSPTLTASRMSVYFTVTGMTTIIRKTDSIHHHHPEGVVYRSFCLNSGTVAVSKVTSGRRWCTESLFPFSQLPRPRRAEPTPALAEPGCTITTILTLTIVMMMTAIAIMIMMIVMMMMPIAVILTRARARGSQGRNNQYHNYHRYYILRGVIVYYH